jgi:hypothetical protein
MTTTWPLLLARTNANTWKQSFSHSHDTTGGSRDSIEKVVPCHQQNPPHNLLRWKAWSITLRGCNHAAGKCCEKCARMYAPVPLAWLRAACLSVSPRPFSLLLKTNGTIYFLYFGTQMPTLSTAVLNDPSFTTHDLLRLLWQSSPYSGILTQFRYPLTFPMPSLLAELAHACTQVHRLFLQPNPRPLVGFCELKAWYSHKPARGPLDRSRTLVA